MRIVTHKPPIYEQAEKQFGIDFEKGVILTYGDCVHVASGELSNDLIQHESVHIKQQSLYPGGPDAWWKRYFDEAEFRLNQEAEAYKVQLEYLLEYHGVKAKQQRFNLAKVLAHQLSSPMYGNCCDVFEALRLIQD